MILIVSVSFAAQQSRPWQKPQKKAWPENQPPAKTKKRFDSQIRPAALVAMWLLGKSVCGH
jgi:hypothetical protein